MKNLMKSILILALVLLPQASQAQLATTNTTLSAAISSNTTTEWCIASAAGVVLPSLSGATSGSLLYVDQEAAQILSQGSSTTCYRVRRGSLGTSANWSHASGATVYVGAAATGTGDTSRPFSSGPFIQVNPQGSCTATAQYVLPVINTNTGVQYNCVGSVWVSTSAYTSTRIRVTGVTPPSAASPAAAEAVETVTGGVGGAQSATTGNGAAGAAITDVAGVGGAGGSSSGTGGTGGAITETAGAGGGTVTGGTGGAVAITSGAGGAGSGAGGTGGAMTLGSGAAGSGGTGTVGALTLKQGATTVLGATTAQAVTLVSGGTNQNVSISPSGSGKVYLTGGTDPTKVVAFDASGATAGAVATHAANQAGAITITDPIQTGGVPTAYFCGATSGATTCANSATGGTARVFGGIATLASNSAVISGISPAFTSTTTYSCVANDLTTRANPVQIANTSSSSITITNTTGASDVINYICVGY